MADPAPAAAGPAHQGGPHLRLSTFWPTNPAAWFAMAEGQFIIRGIQDETLRYYHVLPCLPETTINLVTDFVEGLLPADPYTQLKARLLAAHQLTDYQRVEQIFQLPPLGAQKPSEMLAEMLRLCPRGQEGSLFFTYLFLHRLPRELRVLLTDIDHTDRRVLADKADQLWAHYSKSSHGAIHAVEGDSEGDGEPVAALRRQFQPKKGGGKKKKSSTAGGSRPRQQQQQHGLCWYHHTFGDRANDCKPPCSWEAEN
jgi:hypothetical protein